MEAKILELIKYYQLKNKTIIDNNPKVALQFDWSSDAYELEFNDRFIAELRKLLD